eukprot:109680-Lingulodinium_polyedra.AAC.1
MARHGPASAPPIPRFWRWPKWPKGSARTCPGRPRCRRCLAAAGGRSTLTGRARTRWTPSWRGLRGQS